KRLDARHSSPASWDKYCDNSAGMDSNSLGEKLRFSTEPLAFQICRSKSTVPVRSRCFNKPVLRHDICTAKGGLGTGAAIAMARLVSRMLSDNLLAASVGVSSGVGWIASGANFPCKSENDKTF